MSEGIKQKKRKREGRNGRKGERKEERRKEGVGGGRTAFCKEFEIIICSSSTLGVPKK